MYKVVAFWSAPRQSEMEDFERYYRDVHVPKARRVPGLRKIVLTRVDAGLEGAKPAFHRVAELLFDSPETLRASSASPEWRAMREDAGVMVERFGVTLTASMGWESAEAL